MSAQWLSLLRQERQRVELADVTRPVGVLIWEEWSLLH